MLTGETRDIAMLSAWIAAFVALACLLAPVLKRWRRRRAVWVEDPAALLEPARYPRPLLAIALILAAAASTTMSFALAPAPAAATAAICLGVMHHTRWRLAGVVATLAILAAFSSAGAMWITNGTRGASLGLIAGAAALGLMALIGVGQRGVDGPITSWGWFTPWAAAIAGGGAAAALLMLLTMR